MKCPLSNTCLILVKKYSKPLIKSTYTMFTKGSEIMYTVVKKNNVHLFILSSNSPSFEAEAIITITMTENTTNHMAAVKQHKVILFKQLLALLL